MRTVATLGLMVLSLLLFAPSNALADTTVVVRGDTAAGENQAGWMFDRDPANTTPFEFTTAAAKIGMGSLYVKPIGDNASAKFIAELFLLSDLDDLEKVSYDIQLGPNSPTRTHDAEQFYMNVYTNLPDSPVDGFYDCRFDYTAKSVAAETWTTTTVTPNTVADNVKSRNNASCPTTLAGMLEGSTVRLVSLSLGDTGVGDQALDGYFDNVVVTQAGDSTTYDFEASPADKDACKKGGFADYSFKNQGQCVSYVASHGRSS